MYQAMKWMLILAAILVTGSGSLLILALPSKHHGDLISTQRFRYFSFAFAAIIAAVPIVGTSVELGLTRSVRILFEINEANPSWGVPSIVLMTFHVLTIVLWPLMAFYAYKRPARFSHKVFVWESNRLRGYYIRTEDTRKRTTNPTLWDRNLCPVYIGTRAVV